LTQRFGEFGHLLFALFLLGFFFGLFGLLLLFGQLAVVFLFCFFISLLLIARNKETIDVVLFVGLGIFLVVGFDFLGRNFRGFFLNVALKFVGQDLHLGELERFRVARSFIQTFLFSRLRHGQEAGKDTGELALELRSHVRSDTAG